MDTISKDIQILPPRTFANFTMDDPHGCEPHTVNFRGAESPFVDQTHETYEYRWDFGDGTTGKGRFPAHVYDSAGTYYVSMEATGEGGSDVATDTIVVYKVPDVDFDVDPKLVMLPDQVMHGFNFTDHATDYTWDFGDGATSGRKNPEHIYEELGTYDVVLTAWAEHHGHTCIDSLRKEELVKVEGKGFIKFPDAFTPSRSGPSEGYWDPEDTSNDIFHPVGEGVMEYTLEIFNKWGERLFISNDFRVGWDGYFEGELLPQDVYIYKAEGTYSNGTTFEKMGNVTLLR
jgi:gliding motility-associated-like protein